MIGLASGRWNWSHSLQDMWVVDEDGRSGGWRVAELRVSSE